MLALLLFLLSAPTARPFTPEELLQTHRLDDVQPSPDGKRVAFTVRQKNLADNRDTRDVWFFELPAGPAHPFTRDGHSDHPRFSPDGKRLLVVSERGGAEGQLWLFDLESGGDGRRLTNVHGGAGDGVFSPDGRLIAYTAEVNPACSGDADEVEACTRKHAEDRLKSKLRAHLTDRLLYRHWNEWRELKRTHTFVISADGGPARDLTPGEGDWPTFRVGGGGDLAFSADGRTVFVSHKRAAGEAWRTNSDLYALPTAGGVPRALTAENIGDDFGAVVSPDGKWLAYRAQARDGFESDQSKLRLIELASGRILPMAELTEDAGTLRWKPDSSGLVVEQQRSGRVYLSEVSLDGKVESFSDAPATGDFALLPDSSLIAVGSAINRPPELYRIARGGEAKRLTSFNDDQYSGLALGAATEEQWTQSSDGARIHSFIVKPPMKKGERLPLLVLIHGGPQGAWEDQWGMRWNASAFAARGYIVLLPNQRGSTGYGEAFKEGVSKDWGGLPYDDVMASVDAAEKRSDVSPGHTCAAGASYGGYLIDWIAGHTNRFKCLVSHAGVFDLVSEYGSTEELWFPEWEFGGPYWEVPEAYRKWSPSSYVKAFQTPTLVTMGELDYRVPIEQPLGMFTALQRRGVESKLLDFPDEGHWINKPRNSQLWYHTVLDWIDEHAKGKKAQPGAGAAAGAAD